MRIAGITERGMNERRANGSDAVQPSARGLFERVVARGDLAHRQVGEEPGER